MHISSYSFHIRVSAITILFLISISSVALQHRDAATQYVPSEEDTILIDCSDDTYILSDYPDMNFDNMSYLRIESNSTNSTSGQSWVFVKFDLSGFNMSNIATLAYANFGSVYAGPYPMVGIYWCHDTSWTEDQITWNNAPMSSIENYSLDQTRNDGGFLHFDITYALQRTLSEEIRSITFVFKAEEIGDQYTYSKENPSVFDTVSLWIVFVPKASLDQVSINDETDSGYIQDMWLYYNWINTGKSHLINIASACTPISLYFPSLNLIGQHYFAPDGTELFIGHSLICYELYNDTNENGYLDANFTSGVIETKYYFTMNFSRSFEPSPIDVFNISNSTTYSWHNRYRDVTGFVLFRNGSMSPYGDTAAILSLEYVEVGYTYRVEGYTSYLKSSVSIGEVDSFEKIDESVNIDGLGLSALYSTILLSSSEETGVFVENLNYDSRDENETSKEMTKANITDSDTSFYDMTFGDNYTLFSEDALTLPVSSSACTSKSVHPVVPRRQTKFPYNFYQGFLFGFLPRISTSTVDINLEYTASSLLYRICYPQWDGYEINHDPTFIAHLGELLMPVNILTSLGIPILILFSVCIITLVVLRSRKSSLSDKMK